MMKVVGAILLFVLYAWLFCGSMAAIENDSLTPNKAFNIGVAMLALSIAALLLAFYVLSRAV
jgi:hypothetical protein